MQQSFIAMGISVVIQRRHSSAHSIHALKGGLTTQLQLRYSLMLTEANELSFHYRIRYCSTL